jgi:exonuclease VII small subunit
MAQLTVVSKSEKKYEEALSSKNKLIEMLENRILELGGK